MANHKKEPLRYTVRAEPIDKIDEDVLNLFCRIAFGMNAEQTVKEVVRNQGGKYDHLFAEEVKV